MPSPLPNWFIQRLTLVYYDPLRLQWQLFQSTTSESEVPHREYIRQLLNSTELFIRKASEGSKCEFKQPERKTTISFKPEELLGKQKILTLCKKNRVVWDSLIDKLQSLAEEARLKGLKDKITKISELVLEVAKLREEKKECRSQGKIFRRGKA